MTSEHLYSIVKYVKEIGKIYETEGFSFYLYGLIKMIKPSLILELGTGYGATAFMAAQACKENGCGKVVTVDDGSQWTEVFNYSDFMHGKIKSFEIDNFINFQETKLNLLSFDELKHLREVNIVFNDIDASPRYFFSLLNFLLPRINKECYFFIDRGATFWPNYCAIELTLDKLNYGKIPRSLCQFIDDKSKFEDLIKKYKFTVQYVRKNSNSDQDSFALIKIEEYDIQVI